MRSASLKLLLVSHASHADEVLEALQTHEFPPPAVGAGGDDTLDVFEELEPDVVIMVAGLAEGDLTSLAAAMRSGHYGRCAPILVIVAENESMASMEAVKNPDFERVLRRPFSAEQLVQAVLECAVRATGDRIQTAMDLAIDSFVSDAMQSLDIESVETHEPESKPPAWREQTQAVPVRESTSVLGEAKTEMGPLTEASRMRLKDELLAHVLPDESLDVDLDELDGTNVLADSVATESVNVEEKSESQPEPVPPDGGDFAKQLRAKMSAMAERLFPGQDAGDGLMPAAAAHTEIDLGAIVEARVDKAEPGSEPGKGADSDITMPHDTRPGSGSASLTGAKTGSATDRPALVGKLDTSEGDVAAVLARLWKRGFSGCLVLVCEQVEKRVHFEDGHIFFASSSHEADRMGELLLRQGKINSVQLSECRAQVKASGRRLGEVLVDQGHLKPRELLPAVRQHLEDIVYSVFAWTEGSYDALPEQTIDERIRLSRHPAALIVEGIRRKYDRQRIESCLGGMGEVLVTAKGDDEHMRVIAAADLSVAETAAQRLFDGEHTLDDASAQSQLEGLRVAQLAHAWICLGLAELASRLGEMGMERTGTTGYLVGETDLAIDRQRVRAKCLLVEEADYFQLLGVRSDASAFEIRRAYESARQQFGAESFPESLQQELAEELDEIAEMIEEAFVVLSDDRTRSTYRANLR